MVRPDDAVCHGNSPDNSGGEVMAGEDVWQDTETDVWEDTLVDVWEDIDEAAAAIGGKRPVGLLLGVYP